MLLLCVCSTTLAQSRIDTPRPQIILVTIGPGDEVWEKFGHNMLWARDPERGIDLCYNWGLFDFDQPGFIWNFARGRMTYWMDGFPPGDILGLYYDQKRATTMQRLNLSPQQGERLIDLCEQNRKPENREYKYDYFKDNCCTRVRDMIDRVTDGGLSSLKTVYAPDAQSYRWHALRLMQSDWLLMLGVDFTLGPSTDRPLTEWQECFLPAKLQKYVTPLVESTRTPWPSDRPPEPAKPPILWPWLGAVGVFGAGVIALAGWWKQWLGTILIGLWWCIAGLGGAYLMFMWFFTDHTAAYANQNLWHVSPLAWGGLIPLIFRRPRVACGFALTIAGISIFGLLFRTIGMLSQQNWDFIALSLPLNLAVAWLLTRPRLTPTPAASEVIAP